MKRIFVIGALLTVVLVQGCEQDQALAPPHTPEATDSQLAIDPEQAALELLARAGWPIDESVTLPTAPDLERRHCVMGMEREVLIDDIVHYSFQLRVGHGPHDIIGLHRVVRESRPYRPIRTDKNILLLHGDGIGFVKFLFGFVSPHTPDEHSVAAFLAANDVDVWGIDQGWVLVPDETSEFGFMADWGLERQVDDLRTALGVARFTRLFTGGGCGGMLLGGYSSGGATGYALLNEETQLSPFFRHASGFVHLDMSTTTDVLALSEYFCGEEARFQEMVDAGVYQSDLPFRAVGEIARTDPDGESPFIPGFTNLQTAIFFAAAPFFGETPIHYLAGIWEEGLPVDFRYTTVDQWLDFLEPFVLYMPNSFLLDYAVLLCGEQDSPFDDHFPEIDVPILNLIAAGGIGPYDATAGRTGSTDVTDIVVQLLPDEEVLFDFAHVDLWTALNARDLVWMPLLGWIEGHSGHDRVAETMEK